MSVPGASRLDKTARRSRSWNTSCHFSRYEHETSHDDWNEALPSGAPDCVCHRFWRRGTSSLHTRCGGARCATGSGRRARLDGQDALAGEGPAAIESVRPAVILPQQRQSRRDRRCGARTDAGVELTSRRRCSRERPRLGAGPDASRTVGSHHHFALARRYALSVES